MDIERIKQAREHLLESENIAAKMHKYPHSEHFDGWREDIHAELNEARRLLMLCSRPYPQVRPLRVAA